MKVRPVVPENVGEDGVCYQSSSTLTADGRFEVPDSVPMEPPVGYRAPPNLTEMIRTMVRNEMFMKEVASAGYETFEESDDFDIEDDPLDPLTPYEKVFEPSPLPPADGAVAGEKPEGASVAGPPPVASSKPVGELARGSEPASSSGKSDTGSAEAPGSSQ